MRPVVVALGPFAAARKFHRDIADADGRRRFHVDRVVRDRRCIDISRFWRPTEAYGNGMADGVGFEPTVSLHPRRFSRPVP